LLHHNCDNDCNDNDSEASDIVADLSKATVSEVFKIGSEVSKKPVETNNTIKINYETKNDANS